MNYQTGPPIVSNTNVGIRIKHREYITDISPTSWFKTGDAEPQTGDGNIGVYCYHLNPGNAKLFSWLAGLAKQFQEYRFHGLVFEYISMQSDNPLSAAANNSLGTITVATNYDANDASAIVIPADPQESMFAPGAPTGITQSDLYASMAFSSKVAMQNSEFATTGKPSQNILHMVETEKSQTIP